MGIFVVVILCRRDIEARPPILYVNVGQTKSLEQSTQAENNFPRLLLRGDFCFRHVEDTFRHVDHFLVDGAVLGDGIAQGHRNDLVAAQRRHPAELAVVHHVDGSQAVAGGQHAVEGAGRAAALDVPQHYGAGLKAGAAFDFARQNIADAAQARVPEFVFSQVLHDGSAVSGSTSLENLAPSAATTMLK